LLNLGFTCQLGPLRFQYLGLFGSWHMIHFRMLVVKYQYYWSRDQLIHKLFSCLLDARNSRDLRIIVIVYLFLFLCLFLSNHKLQLLALYIDTYYCDVLLLTETLLKPDLICSVVADWGFTMHCRYRLHKLGGGVAILVKKTIWRVSQLTLFIQLK